MELIKSYGGELVRLVNEMSPYLLLGFFFAGVLRVVFPRHIINRAMGQRNFRSVLNASLLGVPMPLCSCGVLPTGIGFYKNGASRGSTISFLISTPQTGVDSIIATYAMLGLPLAVIRPVVALVTGVFGGLLGNRVEKREPADSTGHEVEEELPERSVKELFRYGFIELLQDISKWLIIGMLVAALLSVLIPADFFTQSISNEYLAMLIMLMASVPLYICATGSIPIAAVLLMKGLSPGAALVLLMAGPATNFATMAVIGNALGRRSLWVYLVSIVGGALLFGTLINEFVPREWIMGAIPSGIQETLHEHSGHWFQWIASGALVLLLINGYVLKFVEKRRS
ncbi:MAG: permease, partial [Bacteroidota bacterium]